METITVAQLRQNPTAAIDAVGQGASVIVTRHRQPVARLVPVDNDSIDLIEPKKSGGSRLAERMDSPRRSTAEVDALLASLAEDR